MDRCRPGASSSAPLAAGVALAALAVLTAAPAWPGAEPEVVVREGRIWLRAEGVPARRLFDAIRRTAGVEFEVQRGVSLPAVTIEAADVPVETAVREVLASLPTPVGHVFGYGAGPGEAPALRRVTLTAAGSGARLPVSERSALPAEEAAEPSDPAEAWERELAEMRRAAAETGHAPLGHRPAAARAAMSVRPGEPAWAARALDDASSGPTFDSRLHDGAAGDFAADGAGYETAAWDGGFRDAPPAEPPPLPTPAVMPEDYFQRLIDGGIHRDLAERIVDVSEEVRRLRDPRWIPVSDASELSPDARAELDELAGRGLSRDDALRLAAAREHWRTVAAEVERDPVASRHPGLLPPIPGG